jgi:hypothetical protein
LSTTAPKKKSNKEAAMDQAQQLRPRKSGTMSRCGIFALTIALLGMTGCQPIMMLSYLVGGPPTVQPDFEKNTKKEKLSTKGKVTLVYCYASKELKWDNESVDYELAKFVSFQLMNNNIKVEDPDRVYAWLDKNPRWNKPTEIGAAFKNVDYIVHIDLMNYSLFEENSVNLNRGRAECIVNVYKMDSDHKDGTRIYSHTVKSLYPTNTPIYSSTMPQNEFKKRYLAFLSNEIGRLFYPTETGQDISTGSLHQ